MTIVLKEVYDLVHAAARIALVQPPPEMRDSEEMVLRVRARDLRQLHSAGKAVVAGLRMIREVDREIPP